ncbi:hypothetical protein PR048_028653 [Dryococelus australis]|uniref:Sister chromatid cohesion protein DCC1 n=1 Tax=Dryococelus australis TaxID=614101 RepID=A0ABQ9GB66_9NEOP|nr:hypothetical protein PR048_028653 [Dryococelus australis]
MSAVLLQQMLEMHWNYDNQCLVHQIFHLVYYKHMNNLSLSRAVWLVLWQVVGVFHKYLELHRCKPRLQKLQRLLDESRYCGPEHEEDLQQSGVRMYNLAELLAVVQASEEELTAGLQEMLACEIDGAWRVLDHEYLFRVVSHILNLVDENSWPLSAVPRGETISTLSNLVPEYVLAQCFDWYTEPTEDNHHGEEERVRKREREKNAAPTPLWPAVTGTVRDNHLQLVLGVVAELPALQASHFTSDSAFGSQHSPTILTRLILVCSLGGDGAIRSDLSSGSVRMERWSPSYCVFALDAYFKHTDSVITLRLFRQHFNIGRHRRVPDPHTITNWVNKFRATVSVADKKPGGSVKSVRAQENIDHLYRLREDRVCRILAEVLLRAAGKFNLQEFLTAWQQSVPEGRNSGFNLPGESLNDGASLRLGT